MHATAKPLRTKTLVILAAMLLVQAGGWSQEEGGQDLATLAPIDADLVAAQVLRAYGVGGSAIVARHRDEIIERFRQRQLKVAVDRREVARALGLKWPLAQTQRSREEIQARADLLVVIALDREFSTDARLAQYRKTAEKLYSPYNKGDQVILVLRGGRGARNHVSGTFYGVTQSFVLIGDLKVEREDVDRDDLVRFDKQLAKAFMERYVAEEVARAQERRAPKLRRAVLDKEFKESGYQRHGKQWVTPAERLELGVQNAQRRQIAAALKEVEGEVLLGLGYIGRNGRWTK